MRLLFLNHNVAWHGGFFRAYHWGRLLAKRGHDVTLLTIAESGRWRFEVEERDGLHLVKTPDLLFGKLRTGWDLWDTFRRICYLLPNSYDLVHSVDSRPVCILPGLALKKFKGVRLVVDWGDWWGRNGTILERSGGFAERLFAPVETLFEERFRRFANGTVVLNSALERRAAGLGVPTDSIVRIPHGADIVRIVPLDQNEARREIGVAQDAHVLGYVGLLFKRDAALLVRAFEIIHAHDSRVKLFLIGNSNVCVPPELIESGSVVVTGSLSYEMLQKYIACCDLMLLPLKNSVANVGRWPSKVCDYLAAGKPVAASRVGDITALIEEGKCGILTEDTPEDFAAGTLQLLGRRDDLIEMGKNARVTAEVKLDWNTLTTQLEQFYLRILNAK